MITVGITGGIGSGKTTVANFFKDYGIPAYIADLEAKKLMHQNPIKEEVLALFGENSYTEQQELNRKYIAAEVFDNKEKLNRLNAIVHPRVAEHFQNWLKNQNAPYVLYEAAILFETGRYKDFDYTILVTAPKKERIKRVQNRDQTSEADILSRMKNQWSDKKKMKLCDFLIKNDNLSKTKERVSEIHEHISKL